MIVQLQSDNEEDKDEERDEEDYYEDQIVVDDKKKIFGEYMSTLWGVGGGSVYLHVAGNGQMRFWTWFTCDASSVWVNWVTSGAMFNYYYQCINQHTYE